METLSWPEIALRFAGLFALIAAAVWASDRYSDRLEREEDGPMRPDIGGAFPAEKSGVVRREGVERERKVAGE